MSRLDKLCGLFRDFIGPCVHHMGFEGFFVDWLKCAQAHVKRQLANFPSAPANGFKNFWSEMQPGRRSRHRSGPPGEHRLIALAIGSLILAVNVRREGHVSQAIDVLRYAVRIARSQSYRSHTEFTARQHFRLELAFAKQDSLANVHL